MSQGGGLPLDQYDRARQILAERGGKGKKALRWVDALFIVHLEQQHGVAPSRHAGVPIEQLWERHRRDEHAAHRHSSTAPGGRHSW